MRTAIAKPLIALAALPTLVAFAAWTSPMQVDPVSRLWVKGTSTVRAFECQATSFDARVTAAGPEAVTSVLAGEKGVAALALTIPTDKLDCRNGTMNGHMLKALKATEHPVISFALSSYTLNRAAEGIAVDLQGTLTLGGVEKPVTIAATAKPGPDGTLQVTGAHELNMKEFGLKPPTLMLGTMKVNERVTVGFDFQLRN